jgi:hypothetical protein
VTTWGVAATAFGAGASAAGVAQRVALWLAHAHSWCSAHNQPKRHPLDAAFGGR